MERPPFDATINRLQCLNCGGQFDDLAGFSERDLDLVGASRCGGGVLAILTQSYAEIHDGMDGMVSQVEARAQRLFGHPDLRVSRMLGSFQDRVFEPARRDGKITYSCICCLFGTAVVTGESSPEAYMAGGGEILLECGLHLRRSNRPG